MEQYLPGHGCAVHSQEEQELVKKVSTLILIDPNVRVILEAAKYVRLFIFNDEDYKWKTTDIQGNLFVYTSNGEEHHMLIMNRLNRNNLVEPVAEIIDLHLKDTLLMIRDSSSTILGVLFYDSIECTKVTALLDELVRRSEIKKNVQENQATPSYKGCRPKVHERVGGLFCKPSGGASHFGARLQDRIMYICPQRRGGIEQAEPALRENLMSNPVDTIEYTEEDQQFDRGEPKNEGDHNPNKEEYFTQIQSQKMEKISVATMFRRCTKSESSATGASTSVVEEGCLRVISTTVWPPVSSLLESTSNTVKQMHTLNELPFPDPLYNGAETPQKPKPVLVVPDMFTSANECATSEMQITLVPSKAGAQLQLCPTPSAGVQDNASVPIEPQLPLTKYQLWQAFNYLIEHDPNFVGKLNDTFMKYHEEITCETGM